MALILLSIAAMWILHSVVSAWVRELSDPETGTFTGSVALFMVWLLWTCMILNPGSQSFSTGTIYWILTLVSIPLSLLQFIRFLYSD